MKEYSCVSTTVYLLYALCAEISNRRVTLKRSSDIGTSDAHISLCEELSDRHACRWDIGHLLRPSFLSPSVQCQTRPGHCACIVLITICSYFSLGNRDLTPLHCTSMRLEEVMNQLNNNNNMTEPLNEGDTIPRFSTIQVNSPLSKQDLIYTKRLSSRASYQGKPSQCH